MANITVGRYSDPGSTGYQGWVEPEDATWIMFVSADGNPVVYLNRAPDGAVL